MTRRLPPFALIAGTGLLALAALPAHAVYKVIGPDGKVTYTDTPPPAGSENKVKPLSVSSGGGAPSLAGLPVELRQAVSQYPVTLYTTPGCRPCDNGRQLLQQRGIPFAERIAGSSSADQTAMQRLTGGTTLPVLTIGQQQLKGLTPSEWHSYLDAAGYPRESRLPGSYRPPAAAPLVTPAEPESTPAVAPAAPAAPDESPPSGPNIRF
jgi:glutaredoxin